MEREEVEKRSESKWVFMSHIDGVGVKVSEKDARWFEAEGNGLTHRVDLTLPSVRETRTTAL